MTELRLTRWQSRFVAVSAALLMPLKFPLLPVAIGAAATSMTNSGLLLLTAFLMGLSYEVWDALTYNRRLTNLLDLYPQTRFVEVGVEPFTSLMRLASRLKRSYADGFSKVPTLYKSASTTSEPSGDAAQIRVFVHKTHLSALSRPPTYFVINCGTAGGFVCTSVGANELTASKRFFICHELGHCLDAQSFSQRTTRRTLWGALACVLLWVFTPVRTDIPLIPTLVFVGLLIGGSLLFAFVPRVQRELGADLFSVLNLTKEEAQAIRESMSACPRLFGDRLLTSEDNARRHSLLDASLHERIHNEPSFVSEAEGRIWAYAIPRWRGLAACPVGAISAWFGWRFGVVVSAAPWYYFFGLGMGALVVANVFRTLAYVRGNVFGDRLTVLSALPMTRYSSTPEHPTS